MTHQNLKTLAAVAFLALPVSFACAHDDHHHSHGAHEHGAAEMNVAVEHDEVEIEIHSPLANFLSFEHAATTPAQKNEVKAMAAKLYDAGRLFTMERAAGCRLHDVDIESKALGGDIKKDGSIHADKDDAHDHGHAQANHNHGDVEISYTFKCRDTKAVRSIETRLFKEYPALHSLRMQLLTLTGEQRAQTLTAKNPSFKW